MRSIFLQLQFSPRKCFPQPFSTLRKSFSEIGQPLREIVIARFEVVGLNLGIYNYTKFFTIFPQLRKQRIKIATASFQL